MRNDLASKALIGGIILNFVLPFTYNNGNFVTKPVFSWGNPALILFYALLVLILFSAVSKKDTENKGKILLDKPMEIPKTILRSVLELLFGIIFLLVIPVIGSLYLYWNLGLSGNLTILIFLGYVMLLVTVIKKIYWSKLI